MSLQSWKEKSKDFHREFASLLGDRVWDRYKLPQNKLQLWQKIAIAVYGKPKADRDDFGLSKDQKQQIDELRDKCIKYSKKRFQDVYIAFIYTCVYRKGKIDTVVPVIRVRWDREETRNVRNSYFIDHQGRVYNTWKNYLEENIWDLCWICVPEDGIYLSQSVECADFWNQTSRGEVVETLDNISTVSAITTSVSSLGGLAMTLFPPTALIGSALLISSAIVGAPGAVYGTGRSVCKIVDRCAHDQSIGLENAEARQCWLNAISSMMSVATLGTGKVLSHSAKLGFIASKPVRVVCTALSVASISTSALGVINYTVELAKKDKVTTLDKLQFATSVFFLTHSIVNFQTASTIIKNSQEKFISEMRAKKFAEHVDKYDALHKGMQESYEPGKVRVMHGNAEFIREIRQINNPHEFFSAFNLMPDGNFMINDELNIHPRSFCQIAEKDRASIMVLSRKLKNQSISVEEFHKEVKGICREHGVAFESQRHTARENINKAFRDTCGITSYEQLKVNGKKIFENMKSHEVDRLNQVLQQSCKNYNKNCIEFGMALAEKQGCKNVTEFCAVLEYAVRELDIKAAELRNMTPNEAIPKNVKHATYFREKVLDDFRNSSNNFENLNESFNRLRADCDLANNAGNPRFGNSMAAANHYDKHKFFPKIDANNNLSPKRYFDIAREMAPNTLVNPKWTQDGASLKCTFFDENKGALCVTFQNVFDGKSIIATLFHKDVPQSCRMYKS